MQPNQLAPAPIPVDDTWNQEVLSERLQAFVDRRLDNEALAFEDLGVTI